ncbi:MAG: hypothetical protein JNL79_35135 [Myxococcales bacterium]|nr:hypothetical protein [Myxococcales bacterium]
MPRTTLSLVLLLGCREGPAVLPLEAGPIASVKSAPTAPTTDRWACSVATDCVNACREGAVNRVWFDLHGRHCADGCANQLAAPPRCIAGRCVAFARDPKDPKLVTRNDHCTACEDDCAK